MSGRPQTKTPFAFARYPRSLNRGMRERALAHDEYVILVWLYSRANDLTWVASVTLEQIVEGIAWKHSLDWLWKRLDGLKAKGWIDYPTRPGKKRHSYAIRLLYDGPKPSEESRSIEQAASRSTDSGQTESRGGLAAVSAAGESEHATAARGEDSRSRGGSSRSTGDAASPLAKPDSSSPRAEGVGASRDVGERAKPLSEGGRGEAGSRFESYRANGGAGTPDDRLIGARPERRRNEGEWREAMERARASLDGWPEPREVEWPDTSGMRGEEAILADCEALVAAGQARWVEEGHTV